MTNESAIDYYRVVTEGIDSWSQVYVNVPFDSQGFNERGAVFGAVRLTGEMDFLSKGVGLMEDVEEFVTNLKNKNDLVGLIKVLEAYKAEGIFAWIYLNDDGERVMKVGGGGNIRAVISRGNKISLLRQADATGVMVGKIMAADRVVLGINEVVMRVVTAGVDSKDLSELTKKIMTERVGDEAGPSGSALILDVGEMIESQEDMKIGRYEGTNSGIYEDKTTVVEQTIPQERLVSNRVVGTAGWRLFLEKWRRGISLRQIDKQKRHRWVLFLGGVFMVALVFSVVLGMVKAKNNRVLADFKSVYEPWEQKRQDAESLYTLNPVGAREILRTVREDLDNKKSRFAGGPFEGKVNDFAKQLENTWTKVSGEITVQPELVFNLGLIRTNLRGTDLAFNDKELLVLDKDLGVVAKIDFESGKSSVVLGKGEGQNWRDIAGFKNNLVVIKDGGLVVDLNNVRADFVFDGSVSDPIAVDIFGEATYVLDRGAGEIWRYGLSGGVVGDRRRWLGTGVTADLGKSLDMAVDGDIYVLSEAGKVMKLRRGQAERFGLVDTPEDLNPDRVAVAAGADILALLDSKKSRVVLFNKETGAYLKQLFADEFSKASDLVLVDRDTIVILEEGKLMKVRL